MPGVKARHFCLWRRVNLNRSPTAYKVHDDRDDREDQKQVDQKRCDVQDGKTADPQEN